jgi:hypothetical protein
MDCEFWWITPLKLSKKMGNALNLTAFIPGINKRAKVYPAFLRWF